MKETRIQSFKEYLRILAEQVRKHGKDKMSVKDSIQTLSVGFSSPDGIWVCGQNHIEGWARRRLFGEDQSFKEVPSSIPNTTHHVRGGQVSKEMVMKLYGPAIGLAWLGEEVPEKKS